MNKFEKSKNWNLILENGKLLLTKGGDELFLLDELAEDDTKLFFELYNQNFKEINVLDSKFSEIVQKLIKAGALFYADSSFANKKNLNIYLTWYGDVSADVLNFLNFGVNERKNINIVDTLMDCDLQIIFRTNKNNMEILKDVGSFTKNHFFVDVAYAKHISIGPLVIPGFTACMSCFIGRVTRNWGDPQPPDYPQVLENAAFVAGTIDSILNRYQEMGSFPDLLEKVVTMNTENLSTVTENVYRLPWCPFCFKEKNNEGLGSFELPWTAAVKK